MTEDPSAFIAIQVLDVVWAGILGALFYIVVADQTEGSGRYNLAQGVSAASWEFGAALRVAVAGLIVNASGYAAAFLFLAARAAVALALFWFGVPETRDYRREQAGCKKRTPEPNRQTADA